MKKHLRERFLPYFSSMGGGASIAGAHNVCHTLCIGVIALLSIMGVTVSGMPLMWLNKYNVWFWLMGLVFFAPMLYLFNKHKGCISNKPLLLNGGLLVAGIPFKPFQSYVVWLWIIGGALVAASIILFVKDRIRRKDEKKKKTK